MYFYCCFICTKTIDGAFDEATHKFCNIHQVDLPVNCYDPELQGPDHLYAFMGY